MSDKVLNGSTVIQTIVLSPMSLEPMHFDDDLAPIEVQVTIKNEPYVLREASAGAAIAYANARMRAAKMNDGKLSGFDGMFDADAVLLSLCLHPVDKGTQRVKLDANGNPFSTPIQTIKGWLNRVYKPLFDKVKEISPGLEEKETRDVLRKQLENIQKKLDDLEKKEAPPLEDDGDGPPVTPEIKAPTSVQEERAKN